MINVDFYPRYNRLMFLSLESRLKDNSQTAHIDQLSPRPPQVKSDIAFRRNAELITVEYMSQNDSSL